MATIVREGGLRVVLYLDDHDPPHAHVFGDGHSKVGLADDEGRAYLIWHRKATKREVARAIELVQRHQAVLLERWSEYHD
jgi:hypothetical protein